MGKLIKTNRQFRFLLVYQIFSGLGGGVFSIFMLLSVQLLYDNVLYTGIVGFLMTAPHVFALMVGPIVDRSNKVKIMRLTTLLEFGVLALLTFSPLLESLGVYFMFGVVAVYSIAALFEGPSGTALLPKIVGEDDILSANSFINIAAMGSGIILGIVLFVLMGNMDQMSSADDIRLIYGISTVFLAVSFLSSLLLRDPTAKTAQPNAPRPQYLQDLKAGMVFLRRNVLRFFVIAFIARAFFSQMAQVNMPGFITYHAGAQGYIILAMVGLVGGIIASSIMSTLGKKVKAGYLMGILFMLTGVLRIPFAFVLPLSFMGGMIIAVLFAAVGNAVGILSSSLNQKIPPKDMVGRIDTLETTILAAAVAAGALPGGFVGRMLGDATWLIVAQGAVMIITGILVLFVPSVRKLGLVDEIKREGEEEIESPKELQ